MAESAAELKKHIRIYWGVFIALAILTAVTVWVAGFEAGLLAGVFIALAIAVFKGSLVAAVFMHLAFERQKTLFWLLLLCAIFFAALMLLPVLTTEEGMIQTQEAIKSVS